MKHLLISGSLATKTKKWNEYWIYKAASGFTNRRFFNTEVSSQFDLDLISGGFIMRGFIKVGFTALHVYSVIDQTTDRKTMGPEGAYIRFAISQ